MPGRTWLRTLVVAASLLLATVATVAFAQRPSSAAQGDTGLVTLVQGLRGLVTDVELDGQLALRTFQPERTTEPMTVPAGQHTIEVRAAGAPPGTAPLLSASFRVDANARESAVVHLDDAQQPTLTVYPDEVTDVPMGQGRLVIRHTAAAPAVAVRFDGSPVGAEVPPGREVASIVDPGTGAVTATAGGRPLLPAQDVDVEEGSSTVLYLVGSADQGTLMWLVDVVPGVAVSPAVIRSGDSGLRAVAAASRAAPWVLLVLGGLAVAACGAAAIGATRAHRRVRRVAAGVLLAGALAVAATTATAALPATGRPGLDGVDATIPLAGKLASGAAPKTVPLFTGTATRAARLGAVDERRAVPVAVRVADPAITAPVVATGADPRTGEMLLPSDASVVGWYAPGPAPGEPGSTVIAGHVDRDGTRGAFFDLAAVPIGAPVTVGLSDGSTRSFRVVQRRSFPKAQLDREGVFARGGPSTLVLVTCGGPFDRATRSYEDNVVLWAVPEPGP
jgi:hypothetical protein